jgi:hypothetical protein
MIWHYDSGALNGKSARKIAKEVTDLELKAKS